MSENNKIAFLRSIEPNELSKTLVSKNESVMDVEWFKLLCEKLMDVEWVVGSNKINLKKEGWVLGWNNRKRTLGICNPIRKRIEISKSLLMNNLDNPEVWEDTIRHEIAHALEFEFLGTMSHGKIWKRLCIVTGADPITTCKDPLKSDGSHKFELVCPNCKYASKFYRKPKVNRACGECCKKHSGGRFDTKFKLELVEL